MTGMPRALLSFAGPTPGDTAGATAPQSIAPLFAGSVVSWQAEQLLALGVTHFFVAIEQMVGAAVQLGEQLRAAGATVDFVRSPAELSAMLPATERLAVLAEGLWCDASLIHDLVVMSGEAVVVVEDSTASAPFERIDITHRWAGLALVSGATAATLAELPADWSIESALMRQGLRRGAMRITVPGPMAGGQSLALVTGASVAASIEDRAVRQAISAVGTSPIERYVFAPLARVLVPATWRQVWPDIVIDGAGPVLAIGAVGLSGWGAPFASCCLGMAALAANAVRRAKAVLRTARTVDPWIDGATHALLALAVAALLGIDGSLAWMQVTAALLLAVLAATLRLTAMPGDWDRWKPGLPESALLLALGAGAGAAIWGWWAAVLLCGGFLLADRLIRPSGKGRQA